MHPLESLNEAELGNLARVVDRLLINRHLLAPGQRTNRLRPGCGIEFLDHREYSPGDDIRAVDWRAIRDSCARRMTAVKNGVGVKMFLKL